MTQILNNIFSHDIKLLFFYWIECKAFFCGLCFWWCLTSLSIFTRFAVSKKISILLWESESRFCELTETPKNKTRRNEAEQVLLLLEIHALCSNEGKFITYLFIYLCVKSPRWFDTRLNNAANIESPFECWLFLHIVL